MCPAQAWRPLFWDAQGSESRLPHAGLGCAGDMCQVHPGWAGRTLIDGPSCPPLGRRGRADPRPRRLSSAAGSLAVPRASLPDLPPVLPSLSAVLRWFHKHSVRAWDKLTGQTGTTAFGNHDADSTMSGGERASSLRCPKPVSIPLHADSVPASSVP